MKSDFLLAITQISAEKNLPSEVVLSAVEAALVSAYRKDNFNANQNITVKINPTTGAVQVWAEKIIVKKPADIISEISLKDAQATNPEAQIDETVMVEATPANAGRIAAQTAKQVILQRLHEAEHSAIFEEYADREGDIVTGMVQRIEQRQIFVDLGRTEAILPVSEQVPGERYRIGQRLKVSILEVVRTSKGPRVIVTRSHPDLLRRLFEMEIPEILNGTVQLKSVAREAGYRSKVAVTTSQEGIDPVGCCVGLRGIRIQNIVTELNGEKIDVVTWSPDPATFIASALSPAQIVSVGLNPDESAATVVVPDRQLSLAIGREGQNVRLAAKLAGWRIDIKSASAAEAEAEEALAAAAPKPEAETEEETTEEAMAEEIVEEVEAEVPEIAEPVVASVETVEAPPEPVAPEPVVRAPAKPRLRFAEDIMVAAPTKPQTPTKKTKKKKKATPERGDTEEKKVASRKQRREYESEQDDDSMDDVPLEETLPEDIPVDVAEEED